MTAVIGVLNKYAVAIAADSAVTVGGKIFNKANKVFALSKLHPVGIMIYNSASFMGTPWEIIIKIYRNQLADKSFSTLAEYQQDFIAFLRLKNFYTDPASQEKDLYDFCRFVLFSVKKNAFENFGPNIKTKKGRDKFVSDLLRGIKDYTSFIEANADTCPEFQDYSFDMFTSYSQEIFEGIIDELFSKDNLTLKQKQIDVLKKYIYAVIVTETNIYDNYTGLIFTGYGDDDIYPQLVPIKISMVTDNRLKFYIEKDKVASVNNKTPGMVRAFAQTDVIDTVLKGIDPQLDNRYSHNFKVCLKKYHQIFIKMVEKKDADLARSLGEYEIDEYFITEFNEYKAQIERKHYTNPLEDAVSHLAKEDLSEMAESLIYLTYLKRRITFTEESVGGPVDVAVITKSDGLIWIKRKFYFDSNLNPNFFKKIT
jgi:hypothetical protein